MLYAYTLETPAENLCPITAQVQGAVAESGVTDGICVVYCPHTTAGITINENADPDVVTDLLLAYRQAFPDRPEFRHMEGNSSAHARASAMGSSVTIPVRNGRLVLGTWQGVYFCEFDGPRRRTFYVFFGGAGVSTESGIPDFRSQDGLYHQQYDVPPETILSHTYFERHTEDFYRFYRNKMICLTAKPNAAHKKLAELEQAGKLLAVVTQNIDGLHQMAGSKTVLELHGSVHRNICQVCGAVYDAEWIMLTNGVPHCEKCGGRVKPDVVLYEESLPEETLTRSVNAIANADLLLVGGTSLTVYPAAGLLRYFRGDHLVLLNRDATPMDEQADLCIREPIGKVLEQIQVRDKA